MVYNKVLKMDVDAVLAEFHRKQAEDARLRPHRYPDGVEGDNLPYNRLTVQQQRGRKARFAVVKMARQIFYAGIAMAARYPEVLDKESVAIVARFAAGYVE